MSYSVPGMLSSYFLTTATPRMSWANIYHVVVDFWDNRDVVGVEASTVTVQNFALI